MTTTTLEPRAGGTRRAGRGLLVCLVIVLFLAYLSPVVWLVMSSFKTRLDIFTTTPTVFFKPTLDNYSVAFQDKGFGDNLQNSAIVAVVSTLVALLVGIPAAYRLSRHASRFQGAFLLALLSARLLPAMVLSVPLFVLANQVGVSGTYLAVVAAHLTFAIPFTVWMMRGFFLAVPASLDEAARLDGCSEVSAFFRVVLPLTKGGIAATAIFLLINSWNEFLFALILTSRDTATLPVAIPTLLTPIGTFWGQIAAVATVTVIPICIFAFAVQKYMVAGLTGGALASE
ncbi:MAG: carbohydrate ABC transporter permease [Aeromicrobium sp.]